MRQLVTNRKLRILKHNENTNKLLRNNSNPIWKRFCVDWRFDINTTQFLGKARLTTRLLSGSISAGIAELLQSLSCDRRCTAKSDLRHSCHKLSTQILSTVLYSHAQTSFAAVKKL